MSLVSSFAMRDKNLPIKKKKEKKATAAFNFDCKVGLEVMSRRFDGLC